MVNVYHVSEDCIASIFTVGHCFLLVVHLAYSSTLKLEEVRTLETPVNLYQTIWLYISEDSILHVLIYFCRQKQHCNGICAQLLEA